MERNYHRSRSRDRNIRRYEQPEFSDHCGSRQRSWRKTKHSPSRSRRYACPARQEGDQQYASRYNSGSSRGRSSSDRHELGETLNTKDRGDSDDRMPLDTHLLSNAAYRNDHRTSRYDPRSDERFRHNSNSSNRNRSRDSCSRRGTSPRVSNVRIHVQSTEYNERTEAPWDDDCFDGNAPEPTVSDLRQRIFQRVSQANKSPSFLDASDIAIDSETNLILFAVESTDAAHLSTGSSSSSSSSSISISHKSESYRRLFAAQTLREAGLVDINDKDTPLPQCRVVWARTGGTMPPTNGSKKLQKSAAASTSARILTSSNSNSSSSSRTDPPLSSHAYRRPTKAELNRLEAQFGGGSSAYDPCMDPCMEGDLGALGADGVEGSRGRSREARPTGWSRRGPVWGGELG